MGVQKEDLVQWTVNGSDQFVEPRRVTFVSDCGEYCYVEGSNTGLPVAQLTVVDPEAEEPSETVQPVSEVPERFTFFWRGVFSQWHICRFKVDGIVYNCAEQYMMAEKARTFGDKKTLNKIMTLTDPSFQKKAGRDVHPYDDDMWNAIAKEIVYKGNFAKFTQNNPFLRTLLATSGTLVEASPYDAKWGIGLAVGDPRTLSRGTWKGTNWLGEVLTQLRDDLLGLPPGS